MKRMQWLDSDMVLAMETVKKGQSIGGAARQFRVPKRTLDDRIMGRIEHGTRPGAKSVCLPRKNAALCLILFT